MNFKSYSFWSLLLATATMACGATQPEPTTPEAPPADSVAVTGSAPATAAVPEVWSEGMSMEQQISFMKEKVMPAMAPVFQEADAKEYADFCCATCHGPDNKKPKEFLPHLTLKEGHMTSFTEAPEVSKFMAERVMPVMASALGMEPYNPETHQGFGCGGCHTIDVL